MHQRTKRIVIPAGTFLMGVVVAAVTLIAFRTLFIPSSEFSTAVEATATVQAGSVGASMRMNATPKWSADSRTYNGAGGVLTTIDATAGEMLHSGQRIYSVDLRPVVAGRGDIPAYTNLLEGSRGQAVEQLQQFLSESGYFDGEVDGIFGPQVTSAVKSWQEDTGVPVDGIVQRGDIVWMNRLPARVELDAEQFYVGGTVSPGVGAISILAPEPSFSLSLQTQQARQTPVGTSVILTPQPGVEWQSMVSRIDPDAANPDLQLAQLQGLNSSSICSDQCALIPIEGAHFIQAEVIVVPEKSGLVIPSSAVSSTSDGSTVLTGVDGTTIPVSVIQTAKGMSLIEGVEVGFQAILPSS